MLSRELREEIAKKVIKDSKGLKTKRDLEKTIMTLQLNYGDHVDALLMELGHDVFQNKRVLEVGCGFGGTVLGLQKLNAETHGLDIDKEKIRIATAIAKEKCGADSGFLVCAGESICFADNFFDFVISIYALEHVQDPSKVISEMIRVLRPGGILYIHTANYLYPREAHYRVFMLPMMPKFLAKIYLRLRGRDPKFIEEINYITPGRIRKLLRNRVASYRNVAEDRIINHIQNPDGIGLEHCIARKILMTLRSMKLSFIPCKLIRLLPLYFTIKVIAEKEATPGYHSKVQSEHRKNVARP